MQLSGQRDLASSSLDSPTDMWLDIIPRGLSAPPLLIFKNWLSQSGDVADDRSDQSPAVVPTNTQLYRSKAFAIRVFLGLSTSGLSWSRQFVWILRLLKWPDGFEVTKPTEERVLQSPKEVILVRKKVKDSVAIVPPRLWEGTPDLPTVILIMIAMSGV